MFKFVSAYFHRVGTNHHILLITLKSATTSWDSLSTLIVRPSCISNITGIE
jgi:hypothetical protein